MFRLEQVALKGFAVITQKELPHWYDQERTTINIWRDIQAKWDELLPEMGEEVVPLYVAEAEGDWLFVWGEGLTTRNIWLTDVKHLAKQN
jgi:hypothetical protein